jgi:hypothetical protein
MPRSLLVAPEERLPELCVIERTPIIDAEVLRLQRAVLVSVTGENVSHSVIAALPAEVLEISISSFSVHTTSTLRFTLTRITIRGSGGVVRSR